MEPISKSILLAMAVNGQTISRNTSVSVALVAMIIGATVWVTTAFTSTEARLSNVELDIQEMKDQNTLILNYLYSSSPFEK